VQGRAVGSRAASQETGPRQQRAGGPAAVERGEGFDAEANVAATAALETAAAVLDDENEAARVRRAFVIRDLERHPRLDSRGVAARGDRTRGVDQPEHPEPPAPR